MPFNLTELYILAAEQELGTKLPEAYRSSMLQENGGEVRTEEDVWQQYPIADTSDRKRLSRTTNHIIKETENCRGWPSFPDAALTIAGNGCGDQLVLLKQGASFSPTIYVWSHETGQLVKVADDFYKLKAL